MSRARVTRATAHTCALGALAASLCVQSSCNDESLDPRKPPQAIEPLGIFSPTRPADPTMAARDALLRDARRREARFLDTANPGFFLARSSPDANDIFAGAYPPDVLYEFGAQLFHYHFTLSDGLGTDAVPFPTRVQKGTTAAETTSCASCHLRGGMAGAGDASTNTYLFGDGDRPSSGLTRNARSLTGAGWIELVASEMTRDLRAWRASCVNSAKESGFLETAPLLSKGVDFGTLVCSPDGSVDTSDVQGVDVSLEVRPFGWKGTTSSIRQTVREELRTHLGLDMDTGEITEGQLAAITTMLALGDTPIVEMPDTSFAPVSFWAEGYVLFEEIGCAACHAPSLPLDNPRLRIGDPNVGFTVDLSRYGSFPKPDTDSEGVLQIRLFSDLKRHDLGDDLADAKSDRGVSPSQWITPPLWDIARTRPYLHDGRAPTLHDAIVQHGGEAAESRDAYVDLGEEGQGPIRVFLMSLTREKRYASP